MRHAAQLYIWLLLCRTQSPDYAWHSICVIISRGGESNHISLELSSYILLCGTRAPGGGGVDETNKTIQSSQFVVLFSSSNEYLLRVHKHTHMMSFTFCGGGFPIDIIHPIERWCSYCAQRRGRHQSKIMRGCAEERFRSRCCYRQIISEFSTHSLWVYKQKALLSVAPPPPLMGKLVGNFMKTHNLAWKHNHFFAPGNSVLT